MFSPLDILFGFIVPPIVCAVLLLLAWRPWNRLSPPEGRWIGGLAIGLPYAIAYARLVDELQFPPTSSDNWIVYFMAVAAVLGVLFCELPPAFWPRLVTTLIVCIVLIWLLLRPLIGTELVLSIAIAWIACLSVAMTIWGVLINQIARSGPRLLAPLALLLASAAQAVVLGDGGLVQRGGFTLGALAIILAAIALMSAFTPGFKLAGGGILAISIILFGTTVFAYFYIEPEPNARVTLAMALALVSPVLGWIAWLPGLRSVRPWLRGGIALVCVAIAAGAGVAVAELRPAESPTVESVLGLP